MATKPATLPRIWASAGVYTTGPFIGSPSNADPGAGISAEGHRPGSLFPTPAEYENYQQLWQTTWVVDWLAQGSSAGAADAHILETDSVGRFRAVGARFVDAVDETVLEITGANTIVPAVFVTSAATSYQANMGNNAGTGFSAPVGTAAGVGFLSSLTSTAAGGAGVSISADAATAGDCIAVDHAGSGTGIKSTATGTGFALDIVGSALALYGARFVGGGITSLLAEGVGGAAGAIVQSSTTAAAVALAATLRNNTGSAITVSTPAGSTTAARGILSSVSGSAVAGEFVAPANYACKFTGDTTSPTFPVLFVTGQNARPGSTSDGGFTYLSTEAQFAVASSIDGTWRGVWTSLGGSAQAWATSYSGTYNTLGGAVWVPTITAATTAANQPATSGTLRVRVTFEARSTIVGAGILNYRLVDLVTPANTVTYAGAGIGANAGTYIPGATVDWSTTICFILEISVTAGARSFRLDIQNGTGNDKAIRRVAIEFLGLY